MHLIGNTTQVQKQYKEERKSAIPNQSVAKPCRVHSNRLQKYRIGTKSLPWHRQNWSMFAIQSGSRHSHLQFFPANIAPPLAGATRRRRTSQISAWWGTKRHSSESLPHNPTSIWVHWRIWVCGKLVESSRSCIGGAVAEIPNSHPSHQIPRRCRKDQKPECSQWWKKAPKWSQTWLFHFTPKLSKTCKNMKNWTI